MINTVSYLPSNGGVIDFNGGRIDFPQVEMLKPSVLTLSCWLNAKTTFGVDQTNCLGWDGGSQDAYGISLKNAGFLGTQGWRFKIGASELFFSTLMHNTWYHLTGTCSSSGSQFFVNGSLLVSDITITSIPYNGFGAQRFAIGWDGINYAPIICGDLRVYNRALSPLEIKQIFNSTRKRFGV